MVICFERERLKGERLEMRKVNDSKSYFRPLVYRVMITPVTGLSSVLVFSNKALPDFSKVSLNIINALSVLRYCATFWNF